jgi:hypothetical protein
VARRDRKTSGGDSVTPPRALRFSQRLAPLSARTLPWLPERTNQLAMGGAFARWPELWGLRASGPRCQGSRRALERAFPDQDVDRLLSEWVRERSRGVAACVNYLARWTKGRPSRLIRPVPGFELPDGPCVFAFLHYSIDPAVQLACMSAAPGRRVRCVNYPIQPEIEDDRELWLAGAEIPPEIAEMLLMVTDPRWVATGIDHLEEGGAIFMALDAPFDAYRPATATIPVGRTQLPLAPSIELFADVEDVQLVLAWPYPRSRGSWMLDVRQAASVDELAGLAGEWIESHQEHWAGLPFLAWRHDATVMRENVRKLRAGIALG